MASPTTAIQSMLGGFIKVLSLRGGSILVQMALFFVLVRTLSTEDVGYYVLIIAIWRLTRDLGPMGLNMATLKDVVQFETRENFRKARAIDRYSLRVVAGSMLVFSALGWVFAEAVLTTFPFSWLPVFVCFIPLAVTGLISSQLRARFYNIHSQFPEVLSIPLFVLVGVLLWKSYAPGGFSLDGLLWLFAGVTWLNMLGAYALYHFLVARKHKGEPDEKPDMVLFRRHATTLLGSIAISRAMGHLPTFFLMMLLGPESVALWGAAMQFAMFITVLHWGMSIIAVPMLSRAISKGRKQRVRDIFTMGCWLSFIPGFAVLVLYAFLGEWMLLLLGGEHYVEAYHVMLLITLGFVVNASGGPMMQLFNVSGEGKTLLYVSLFQFAVTLIMLPSLIHMMGLEGAGAALVVMYSVWIGALSFKMHQKLGFYAGLFSINGLRHAVKLLPVLLKRGS